MAQLLSHIAEISQALSDENRVRALVALRKQELCVCQLICLLDLAPSTVSKHMTILKQAGLVEARKSARWVYYRIADTGNRPEIAAALKWVLDSLARTPETREDDRRLREILATDLDEICCRIRR
ncbi:MAG: winged helix-turn-helix transcriptional regulator [candidate division Zixibacteria bacterium]|nr:winged helix-turn-helix transcriptional regulator [candidate division Zixibacteria bacterium]